MESVFVKLFEVFVWHDYIMLHPTIPKEIPRLYDIRELIEIIPTERTQELLDAYHLLFKPTKSGFMVITRIEEEVSGGPTFIRFDKRIQLSFLIIQKDPYFFNYTNLDLENIKGYLLYFNNLNSNILNVDNRNFTYLSKSLAGFAAGTNYLMGDMIHDGTYAFEVVDMPVVVPPNPLLLQDTWEKVKKSQYITNADRVAYSTGVYRFEGLNENPGQEIFFGIHNQFGEEVHLGLQDIPGEDIPIQLATYPDDPQQNLVHPLFFRNAKEGLYVLDQDGIIFDDFYLITTSNDSNILGIIDLFHTPPNNDLSIPIVPPNMAFINAGPNPLAPMSIPTSIDYHLHFKERMTKWRYISKAGIKESDRLQALNKAFKEIEINGRKMPNANVLSLQRDEAPVAGLVKITYRSNIYV